MKKSPELIRRVGLIANPDKLLCRRAIQQAARLIRAEGRTVLSDAATIRLAGLRMPAVTDMVAMAQQSDLLLVFGGDGTMLRVAREIAGCPTPILGINAGALGFLTAVTLTQMPVALRQIWAGAFELESRPLMEAAGTLQGQVLAQCALNDFVISRGPTSRMIQLEVRVDEGFLTNYSCDGLIVSSPTGSTAYSLAAGGAIITPDADVFSITPICPHTLNNRSVIVSMNAVVSVKILSRKLETFLTADGQVQIPLAAADQIAIRRSRHHIRLLRPANTSFFKTLRQKLNWSGTNV